MYTTNAARALHFLKPALDAPLIALGVVLYHARLAPFVIRRRRKFPRVLMFHALLAEENSFIAKLNINTRPSAFAAQLRFLSMHYHLVSMPDYDANPLPPAALFITFDDGFRSVYQHAFPALKAAGAPATCYVCTDVIDNHSLIWLNELAWFLHEHRPHAQPVIAAWLGLPKSAPRGELIKALIAHYDHARIATLLDTLRASTGVSPEKLAQDASLYLARSEIAEMAQSGITFGNHSGSHAVLPQLSTEDCRAELTRAREALERLPGSIPSLAYPFGRVNEETRRIAIELGYTTLLEVEGLNKPVDPLRVGRLNVTSDSPAVLFARLEIVAPVKWRLKQFLTRSRSSR